MATINTPELKVDRAQREKEAMRWLWDRIAWVSAFVAVMAFFFGSALGEGGTVLFIVSTGACVYALSSRGGDLVAELSLRFGVFWVVVIAGFFLFIFGLIGWEVLGAIFRSIFDWLQG